MDGIENRWKSIGLKNMKSLLDWLWVLLILMVSAAHKIHTYLLPLVVSENMVHIYWNSTQLSPPAHCLTMECKKHSEATNKRRTTRLNWGINLIITISFQSFNSCSWLTISYFRYHITLLIKAFDHRLLSKRIGRHGCFKRYFTKYSIDINISKEWNCKTARNCTHQRMFQVL